tara:strand:- start:1102 stop:1563 length:462 start_codon:yes stop_codon:yes gene_type:complete
VLVYAVLVPLLVWVLDWSNNLVLGILGGGLVATVALVVAVFHVAAKKTFALWQQPTACAHAGQDVNDLVTVLCGSHRHALLDHVMPDAVPVGQRVLAFAISHAVSMCARSGHGCRCALRMLRAMRVTASNLCSNLNCLSPYCSAGPPNRRQSP